MAQPICGTGRGRRRAGGTRPIVVGAVAGALFAIVFAIIALTRPGPQETGVTPEPSPNVFAARERAAEALLLRAQRAREAGQWLAVLRDVGRLQASYADTLIAKANQAAIAALAAEAKAGLQAAPPPPPPPSNDPEAWPVAFEDRLDERACLGRALLFRGQYGGHFQIDDASLAISGVHTNSACWWECPVGETCQVSVDLRFGGGVPVVLLSGPGYGSHPGVGYALHLPFEDGALAAELRRQGSLLGLPLRVRPFQPGEWHRLDLVRDGGRIALRLDGEAVGEWQDPDPLRGPMHAFVGLASLGGLWGNERPHFRNLAIRMPQAEADRLAKQPPDRLLDPPVSTPPQPNGERLFADDFAEDGFSRWTAVQRPDAARVRDGRLVLQGPNAWPVAWRDEPVRGAAAVEYTMSYFPNSEALNFHAQFRIGDSPRPEDKTAFGGWRLALPAGTGQVALAWHDAGQEDRVVAVTSYFVPVPGRPYVLRVELSGRAARVFVNGRFLLEAAAPDDVAADAPVTPGVFQIYGGSAVERVEAWRIADFPAPPQAAGKTVDFGPRLAAWAAAAP